MDTGCDPWPFLVIGFCIGMIFTCLLFNQPKDARAEAVTEDELATLLWSTRVEIADYWDKPSQSGEINRGSAEMLAQAIKRAFSGRVL